MSFSSASPLLISSLRAATAWLLLVGCGTSPFSYAAAPWAFADDPAIPAEPANHVSFVRGYDGQYALVDWQLKKDILSVVKDRFSRIDIVMQQCNSGGFLNDVSLATGVPRTITTSAAWNEVSWNVVQAENTPSALWNFTNEWQAAARANPHPGVREIAFRAREKDWVGPVSQEFQPSVAEHPQYFSPDDPAGGANDTTTLGAATGVKQYAVIAGWGRDDTLRFRHQVNAARMMDLLKNEYQVPADQIATLWGDGTYNLSAPGVIRPGTEDLGPVPVNLLTSRTNWLAALQGSQFATPSTTNDKLLVYFTGHGGHGEWRRDAWQSLDKNGDLNPDGVRWKVDFRGASEDAFGQAPPAGGEMAASSNPQMLGDRDEDGIDHIQLHLREGLSFNPADANHATLLMNGVDVTEFVQFVTGTSVLNIPPRREGAAPLYTPYVYQVDVPRSLVLGLDPDGVTIDIEGVEATLAYRDLLLAADFRSGDHEYLFVNVPEPSSALLVLLALALLGACRRPTVLSR